ncbi:MAG: allophycocyanin subunit beta [Prochlorococcus sp.]|nr:allophycocyanin subunit beta [Prochlorococcaceae cyanobacterium Fu_MAG_50]
MRDAISGLIGRYDQLGRYLDRSATDRIEDFFAESALRLQAVELINREATEIVREASQRLFESHPDLLLPGGNAYTTRRLAACLRDIDYFLRYASYALVAGDNTILDERVLNGLGDTYKSLGVPTGPIVRSIVLLADVICEALVSEGCALDGLAPVQRPFDHMAHALAECDVRQR